MTGRLRDCALAAVCVLAGGTAYSPAPQRGTVGAPIVLTPSGEAVPSSYFGMHLHRALPFSPTERQSIWPADAGFSAIRLWDAHVAWPDLEPARGRWDFKRLDSLVAMATARKASVLLTLGLTPSWASMRPEEPSAYGLGNQAPPRDTADWRRYVDTVARRYRGRIDAYEIWNEPNLNGMFSGSLQQLMTLAMIADETITRIDSAASVTTPSATGGRHGVEWLSRYMDEGGGQYARVVAFHFYVAPNPPDSIVKLQLAVRAIADSHMGRQTPIWNTETGWPIDNRVERVRPQGPPGSFGSAVLDSTNAAAYVAQALVLGWCSGMTRFYWYAWDNRRMGLIEPDGQHLKRAARTYRIVRKWMLGATVTRCDRRSNGIWVVAMRRGTHEERLLWSAAAPAAFSIPWTWNVTGVHSLPDDRSLPLRDHRIVAVSSPVRLISRP